MISHPGGRIADRWESIFSFVVTGARPAGGIVDLPHEISIEAHRDVPQEAPRT